MVLPQALRLMLAPTIGYMVQIVKSTSVASLIGINELTRSAVLINSVTFEPLRVFGTRGASLFRPVLAAVAAGGADGAAHGQQTLQRHRRHLPQPRDPETGGLTVRAYCSCETVAAAA